MRPQACLQAHDPPALGVFQLGSSPDGTVTADVRGDAMPLYVSSTAGILRRLVQSLGPAYLDAELQTDAWSFADVDMSGEVARAQKWRRWLEAAPRIFEATTDRFLGQIECGDIGRIAYPAWGLDAGVRGVVIGWREALAGRRLTITFATLPEA